VSGFVGLERRWDKFDGKSDAVLDKYGIECFEASKMAHRPSRTIRGYYRTTDATTRSARAISKI
jgi:hypothetical protein